MLGIKDIVNGLEIAKAKGFEDTRHGDTISHGTLEDLIEEYNLVNLVNYSNEYGEGYIGFDNDFDTCYQISISKSSYQGIITLSYTLRDLTLNGLNYFIKYIINFTDEVKQLLNQQFNSFLKQEGIDANAQDLVALAIYEPQFKVYLLNFETNDAKWWLTFRECDGDYKCLSKITKKPKGVPVKLKNKKLNINII